MCVIIIMEYARKEFTIIIGGTMQKEWDESYDKYFQEQSGCTASYKDRSI